MGQDLKFSSLKCCCLKNCANHILFIVSVTWVVFTKMSSHPFPFWLSTQSSYRDTLSSQHGCSVWGPSRALPTTSLLPLLASVCVRVWVSFLCLTSTACCLLASSLTHPLDVLLCTPTPWCYISHRICCLVWIACVIRPECNDDMTMSYRCRHVVILCLYSQLALNELWLKWWYRIPRCDFLHPSF